MNHDPAHQTAANKSSDQPLIITDQQTTTGDLVIDTSADEAIKVTSTGRWQQDGDVDATSHRDGLSLERGGIATINGNTAVYGKNRFGIHVEEQAQLTLNGDLAVKGGESSITIEKCSHLSMKRPEKIASSATTAGALQVDEIRCSSGSRLCINGDYQVAIDKVTFQLDEVTTTPPQLAFHLSANNPLQIGQFVLPATAMPAPIIEIAGDNLDLYFDLKTVVLKAFPPGQQSYYQAKGQATPVQLINDASGCLKIPSSAQLTQALAAVDSLAAPICLRSDASSPLLSTSSQLSSVPPVSPAS